MREVERVALVELLHETIGASRYPLSQRIKTLKAVLAKMRVASTSVEPAAPYPQPKPSAQPSAVLAKKRRK